MKAKDYYDQYGEAVLQESLTPESAGTEQLTKLMVAFVREMKEIITERGVKTDRGAVAVIKEQNEKWNALCALFERNLGRPVLKRNGFAAYIKTEIPGLDRALNTGGERRRTP